MFKWPIGYFNVRYRLLTYNQRLLYTTRNNGIVFSIYKKYRPKQNAECTWPGHNFHKPTPQKKTSEKWTPTRDRSGVMRSGDILGHFTSHTVPMYHFGQQIITYLDYNESL